MKTLIIFSLALVIGINTAKSQTASFIYRIENSTVITNNTSKLTFSPKDTFIINWYFQGEGSLVFENVDSAAYSFFDNGVYNVFLVISHLIKTSSSANNWVLSDTSTNLQQVSIVTTNQPKLIGEVKFNTNIASNALVHLLKWQNGNFQTHRVKMLNSDGTFKFENLIPDEYKLWIEPFPGDSSQMFDMNILPTYYGNTTKLDSAIIVNPKFDTSVLNIDLKERFELNGVLRLTGKVSNGNNIAGNTTLLLYDTGKSKIFRYVKSSTLNGEYSMDKIEAGNYLLQPIVNGIPYSTLNLTVSTDNSVVNIDLSTLTTSVKKQFNNKGLFSIYPNPFTDKINIYNGTQSKLNAISIINLQGQLVFKSENLDLNDIELSELNSGLYFITITDTNGFSDTIKVIKN